MDGWTFSENMTVDKKVDLKPGKTSTVIMEGNWISVHFPPACGFYVRKQGKWYACIYVCPLTTSTAHVPARHSDSARV